MGRALRLLASGLLRSRVGVAVLLAVVVFGIVGVARALSGPAGADEPGARPPARPLVTAASTADDGPASPAATPTLVRPPVGPGPEAVGAAFAADWVASAGLSPAAWHNRLRPRMTPALTQELSGVDPIGVPATRLTGRPSVIPLGATVADLLIPVDSGTLRLRLVVLGDRWLVDGVDWKRA
ncbi:MAG TPA: hypothetical protein VHN18_00090 [Micromonosporaceae bacterium]|nr:hypothetical protein [Micromonosporaceae bacterium]